MSPAGCDRDGMNQPRMKSRFATAFMGAGLGGRDRYVIGAALLMATAGTVARTGAELTAKTAVAATASSTNPMDLVLDSC